MVFNFKQAKKRADTDLLAEMITNIHTDFHIIHCAGISDITNDITCNTTQAT